MTNLLAGMTPAESAQAAGYKNQRPDQAASTLLAKPHIAAAVAAGALEKAKEAGGLSEQWLKDKLLEGISKPMRSSQVQCLLAACRTIPGFFKDKESGDVTVNIAVVADLAQRISDGIKRANESRLERGLPPVPDPTRPELTPAGTMRLSKGGPGGSGARAASLQPNDPAGIYKNPGLDVLATEALETPENGQKGPSLTIVEADSTGKVQ